MRDHWCAKSFPCQRGQGTLACMAHPAQPDPADLLPTVCLPGLRLHAVTRAQCVEFVMAELAAGRGGALVTPNLDHLRRLQRDAGFRAVYDGARLHVADGMPLVWAAWLQGTPLPERVAGSDLTHDLAAGLARSGRRLFLLGGDPGTAEAAGRMLVAAHPGLVVAGTACPAPGFERDPAAMQALRDALVAAHPDLVYVALGSPKQERLVHELKPLLPCAWWVGVGISFSFVTGAVRRAPRWMRACGLEWVHRLAQEPRRLARRYLVDGIPFALRLLPACLVRRVRGRTQAT